MHVPLVDITAENAPHSTAFKRAFSRVLASGQFIGGQDVALFERKFAAYHHRKHAIGVSSGTDALLASLMALGIGNHNAVITTPFSFIATANVITRLGATIRFADINEETLCLDVKTTQSAVDATVRAVIPVHLFGYPAPVWGKEAGLEVIEDAAQAAGYSTNESACSCVSFFPTKNLGACGDGGAIVTDNDMLAQKIRTIACHGAITKHHYESIGGNFRLDSLQAAILSIKLDTLAQRNKQRYACAMRYYDLFASVPFSCDIRLPKIASAHCFHRFVIRVPKRDELQEALLNAGIETEIYYPTPLHLQPCFASLGYREGSFPVAEKVSKEVLSIPLYPTLSETQQERVVSAIDSFYRKNHCD